MNLYIYIALLFIANTTFSQTKIEGILLGENKNVEINIFSKPSDEKIGLPSIAVKNIIVKDGIFAFEINELSKIPRLVKIIGSNESPLISKDFYIDKEVRQIVLVESENELDVYISPLNKNQIDYLQKKILFADNNKAWREWENSLKETIAKNEIIDRKVVDSLRNILIDNDLVKTKQYIQENPDSYIALLDLFKNNFGVNEFDSLFGSFNKNIKESDLGKNYNIIRDNLLLQQQNDFFANKEFQLKDSHLKDEIFDKTNLSKKYYLIDFWFSYCAPCIAELPKYKELYASYESKGFEMVSISSDRTKDVDNWLKVIKKHDIPWKQFLDENGIVTKDIGVHKFPTNFLIDNNGNIIQKDIPQYDLENFLKENLN